MRTKYKSKFYFTAGFLLPAIILAISFALIKVWPFGDKLALIVDSIHQYLPFYTDFRNKLVNGGSLLYSFSGGMGYNFWSTYAYYLAAPSNFLLYFVPVKYVCDFMDLMIILRVGLCGGCFTWYLHKKDFTRKFMPVAFGTAFALSALILGYYFNLMWLDSIAMTPLIMYGIEEIINGRSGKPFCFSLAYGLWCNYYIGFMLCLYACLYFILQWVSQNRITWKKTWRPALKFTVFSLLSGGIASVVLIPAYIGLSASESVDGNSFPTVIRFYSDLADIIKSHMAFLEPVNISDTQVGLNVYCGIGTIFFVFLFLLDKKILLRKRIAYFLMCSLFITSFTLNILNYIWHGFHIQNGLPNRFSFLYIAILLVMAYESSGHIKTFPVWRILLAGLIPIIFLAYYFWYKNTDIEMWVYIVSAALFILYVAAALLYRLQHKFSLKAFSIIISIILISEITGNCVYGVYCNSGDSREYHLEDQEAYQTLVTDNDGWYRSEIDRQWMRNVTMYAGGNGIVMFNSTMYASVVDFCKQLGIEARTNKNGYYGVTKLMNDILGIKYLLSPSHKADTMYQFEYEDENDTLILYKNDNALSLGFMVNDNIENWNIYSGNPLEVQNDFVKLATGESPIYKYDRAIKLYNGESYGIKIPDNKQVYVYTGVNLDKVTIQSPEYDRTFSKMTDFLFSLNGSSDDNIATLSVELGDNRKDGEIKAYVYVCSNEDYQKVIDDLSQNQMEDVTVSGNTVTGNIDTDCSGTLLLTVPYDTGWNIYVDGVSATPKLIGETFMGLHLEKGTHAIKMVYTPSGLHQGLYISLGSIFLILVGGYVKKRKRF